MKQAPGFQEGNKVLRLKKSIYLLKQSARVWNQTLHEALEKNGCEQNPTGKCLYVWKREGKVCYILFHVDDLLVSGCDEHSMDKLMESVNREFAITRRSEALSRNWHRTRWWWKILNFTNTIHQQDHWGSWINGSKDFKVASRHVIQQQEGTLLETNGEYRKLIGMLLYLTTNTRPDIAASVAILSKKVEHPQDNDLNEVKRVIRYLKGTRNLKLKLNEPNGSKDLLEYSDASWAEARDWILHLYQRRNNLMVLPEAGLCNPVISWSRVRCAYRNM